MFFVASTVRCQCIKMLCTCIQLDCMREWSVQMEITYYSKSEWYILINKWFGNNFAVPFFLLHSLSLPLSVSLELQQEWVWTMMMMMKMSRRDQKYCFTMLRIKSSDLQIISMTIVLWYNQSWIQCIRQMGNTINWIRKWWFCWRKDHTESLILMCQFWVISQH